jgi:WD40 repeat protein
MQITCFQCRQQLEVPDESAGKRVRCPHCQYVIVAPAKVTAADSSADALHGPLTALPSLELDDAGDRPAAPPSPPVVHVPPLPALPPVEPPPKARDPRPPVEELPPAPPIERGSSRRRVPASARGPTPVRWTRAVTIGVLCVVIFSAVICTISSVLEGPRRHQQKPFAVPAGKEMKQFNIQPMPAPELLFPKAAPMAFFPPWDLFESPQHQFKIKFPGPPQEREEQVDFVLMRVFEVRHGDWNFNVAHRTLPAKEFLAVPLATRFLNLRDWFQKNRLWQQPPEQFLKLRGFEGREWTFIPDGPPFYVRSYYIKDGELYHHYVLTARGPNFTPREDQKISRFFESFDVLLNASPGHMNLGTTVLQDSDDVHFGPRQGREYTALALHPNRAVAVVGISTGEYKLVWLGDNKPPSTFVTPRGKPVDQACISPDGRWLAIAANGEIQVWGGWDQGMPGRKYFIQEAQRCAFTRDQHLLVTGRDSVEKYELETGRLVDSIPAPNHSLQGLALSADNRQLAAFDGKEILLWQLPEKKLLGTIAAHDAPITAAVFSPDGKTLASASTDRTIKLWHAEARQERATLKQHAWTVWDLAFAPDGKHLASAGLDGMLLLWDVQPDAPRLVWAQANHYPLRAVAWSADGKELYLTCKHPNEGAGRPARPFVCKVRKLSLDQLPLNPEAAAKNSAQHAGLRLPIAHAGCFFTSEGQTLLTAPWNEPIDVQRQLCLWDLATARLSFTTPAQSGGALSPDGKWFLFAPAGRQELRFLEVGTHRLSAVPMPLKFLQFFPRAIFTPDSQAVWIQFNNDLHRHEVPGFRRKLPPLKLKAANDPRVVTIHEARDNRSFLVTLTPMPNQPGLRSRKLYATADGKELPLPKLAAEQWSDFVRLRKSAVNFVEVEDYLQGKSQTIGQQQKAMLVSAVDEETKVGVGNEPIGENGLKVHFWDLKERRPLLTLPEVLATSGAPALQLPAHGRLAAISVANRWVRIVPMEWLRAQQAQLPCPANEVAAP